MHKKQPLQNIRAEEYHKRHPGTAILDLQINKLFSQGKTVVQIAMEIPCSESTVYRALRRVQDFISNQNYDRFLQTLRKAIDQVPPNFGDIDTPSALEVLYTAYAENDEHRTEECNAAWLSLDSRLSDLPVAISNPIFDRVFRLCSCYERSGFTDGFKLGVHMANELGIWPSTAVARGAYCSPG